MSQFPGLLVQPCPGHAGWARDPEHSNTEIQRPNEAFAPAATSKRHKNACLGSEQNMVAGAGSRGRAEPCLASPCLAARMLSVSCSMYFWMQDTYPIQPRSRGSIPYQLRTALLQHDDSEVLAGDERDLQVSDHPPWLPLAHPATLSAVTDRGWASRHHGTDSRPLAMPSTTMPRSCYRHPCRSCRSRRPRRPC